MGCGAAVGRGQPQGPKSPVTKMGAFPADFWGLCRPRRICCIAARTGPGGLGASSSHLSSASPCFVEPPLKRTTEVQHRRTYAESHVCIGAGRDFGDI